MSPTLSLPKGLSGTSDINAIAHAVEGLYAKDTNPIVSLMAEQASRHFRTPCRRLPLTRSMGQRAATRSMAPSCAAPHSEPPAWRLHHKLCCIKPYFIDVLWTVRTMCTGSGRAVQQHSRSSGGGQR